MRRFAASIFVAVLLLSGLYSQEVLRGSSGQPALTGHHSDPGWCLCSSDPSGADPAITGEEQKAPGERLYPTVARYRCVKTTTVKVAENIRSSTQADYIFIAEFRVIRFEGPDIIHPYFYSW